MSAGPFDWLSDAVFGVVWVGIWLVVMWRRPGSRIKLATVAVVVPCVMAIGLYIGNQGATNAYNECVRDGELVREALSGYYKEHQFYPEDLDTLGMEKLPGRRVLHGSVLQYETTNSGYDLSFSDWLVSHVATESSPFTAYK